MTPLDGFGLQRGSSRASKIPQWIMAVGLRIIRRASGSSEPFLSTSLNLCKHPLLPTVLGAAPMFDSRILPAGTSTYLGWGRKWSGQRAVKLANERQAQFYLLEDGFLRSVGGSDPSASVVIDTMGIYYDSGTRSLFETLVLEDLGNDEKSRAQTLTEIWKKHRVSKYNGAAEYEGALPDSYVLVIDQTFGDASIDYGLADAASFERMLKAALAENPHSTIFVKTHPDTKTRAKTGYFDLNKLEANFRIEIITSPCHPVRLIENAEAVYTVTSQVGFEAIIWGKPVRTFGMPFYAGWGLTDDELPAPERREKVTPEQLIYAALVKYPRYIDPMTGQRCEVERAIAYIALQRQKRLEFPGKVLAVGLSRWKRAFVFKFLLGSDVIFAKRFRTTPRSAEGNTFAVWGSVPVSNLPKSANLLRIEDGFLRSSGLGANLVRPLSLVIDDVGIYYDATRPSRLELILNGQKLTDEELSRAKQLRGKIINLQITKYNLGRGTWIRPPSADRVVLVVGQVETDASIKLGSPDVQSNLSLLRRVRELHPDAYLVYKPHPDVLAGLRNKGLGEDEASLYCNEVLTNNVSIDDLLPKINEVHTMTSLMGLEALMRGVKVTCHGLPFYAGWGLTEDKLACDRRQRRLSLDELVYGALIAYPRYFNYERNCFVDPEHTLDDLAKWALSGPTTRRWYRKLLRVVRVSWLKLKGSKR